MKKPLFALLCMALPAWAELNPVDLRTEWLPRPLAVEAEKPRLSWRVEETDAAVRGQRQTAYRVRVGSDREGLAQGKADLWDSGEVKSSATLHIEYAGKPLRSGQAVFWQVRVWDKDGRLGKWSPVAEWAMGLLKPEDWKAQWISFKDETPLHQDPAKLHLPPARFYRKKVEIAKDVKRAMLYYSALGAAEMYVEGRAVSTPSFSSPEYHEYFAPGWSDYHQRAYYRAYDLTQELNANSQPNPSYMLSAIVADGWYAGYVGYGLLVGYGPHKTGRSIYGKTPALLAQLEIEYHDGTRETIVTDKGWEVSSDGPIREADLLMGETYDARQTDPGWPRGVATLDGKPEKAWRWQPAILAAENGSTKAKFYEPGVEREVELGFQKPGQLAAYSAPPIVVTEELPAQKITEPKPGVFIFDFGQNFAGNVRLTVKGSAGTKLTLRYGEMLHPDGRLMTENLRKARATDTYILRGTKGDNREVWTPLFTYHGFQYCEVTGLTEKPSLDLLKGLVINNDTPITGDFACSDEVMTQFWRNTVRTQKANFIEIPTDCPQRDERLGWMGDAQVYARTATYNADVAAFFTKWMDDVRESQRPGGAYPDYAPYPFAHGAPKATYGTAWTDAGVIVPYTMWQVYGDRRLIEKHWVSMVKFMDWRGKKDPELKGLKFGNPWGDWLNVNEETPIEYVDLCYHAYSARLMAEMAKALGHAEAATSYDERFRTLQQSFVKHWCFDGAKDGKFGPKIATQSAGVLALWSGLADGAQAEGTVANLVERIEKNGFRMATGFLGTKSLLSVLTRSGHHDLACRLFQSRQFPSWGYEVEQGATSVWERWDSYTKEHGFNGATGKNNAAMNSFSHYAFGAVMEWAFHDLAGLGWQAVAKVPGTAPYVVHLEPRVPSATSNPTGQPLTWVKASYQSPVGKIASQWQRGEKSTAYEVTIPANAEGEFLLRGARADQLVNAPAPTTAEGGLLLKFPAGTYRFEVKD